MIWFFQSRLPCWSQVDKFLGLPPSSLDPVQHGQGDHFFSVLSTTPEWNKAIRLAQSLQRLGLAVRVVPGFDRDAFLKGRPIGSRKWGRVLWTHTGWWFGTFFSTQKIWENPSYWLIFFRGVETTNQHILGTSYFFLKYIYIYAQNQWKHIETSDLNSRFEPWAQEVLRSFLDVQLGIPRIDASLFVPIHFIYCQMNFSQF